MYCEDVPLNTPNPPEIFEFASEGAPKGPAILMRKLRKEITAEQAIYVNLS